MVTLDSPVSSQVLFSSVYYSNRMLKWKNKRIGTLKADPTDRLRFGHTLGCMPLL